MRGGLRGWASNTKHGLLQLGSSGHPRPFSKHALFSFGSAAVLLRLQVPYLTCSVALTASRPASAGLLMLSSRHIPTGYHTPPEDNHAVVRHTSAVPAELRPCLVTVLSASLATTRASARPQLQRVFEGHAELRLCPARLATGHPLQSPPLAEDTLAELGGLAVFRMFGHMHKIINIEYLQN